MAIRPDKIDRLKAQLMNAGIQQTNNPLFQVINQLIDAIKELINESNTGSGGGNVTNEIFNNIFQISDGDSGGGDGEIGPPGVRGIDGITGPIGPAGPVTQGPMGLDGVDGDEGMAIPGPIGATGATGATGPVGPPSFSFYFEDGPSGEDGMPIPGAVGANGSSSGQAWEGNIIGCWGDGDPHTLLQFLQNGNETSATPTQLTTSIARVAYFRLNTAITVNRIRWYGLGATTTIFHVAIYRASDNVRISADNNITTTANAWNSHSDTFTLSANVLYYVAVSVDSTGTTPGPASWMDTTTALSGSIQILPTDWPGNLDADAAIISPFGFGQAVVTVGVLPDPGNAPTVRTATWTGGMYAIFLDANSAA